jgi:hypothetical protein
MNMDAFQRAHTNIDGLGYLRQSYKVFTRLGKSPEIPACYNDETPARSMFPANKSDQGSPYQVAVQVLNSARFEKQNALHTLLESVTKALKTFRPRLGKQKETASIRRTKSRHSHRSTNGEMSPSPKRSARHSISSGMFRTERTERSLIQT